MQDQLSTGDQLNHGRASKKSIADATLPVGVGAAMTDQSEAKGLDEKELQRLSTSKAMAALFLKDKVEKLESDVDKLEFKKDSHFSRGARGGRTRGSSTTTSSRGRGSTSRGKHSNSQSQSHSEPTPKGKERQPHQHSSIRLMENKREEPIDRITSSTESNRDSIRTKTLDIRILDSSVLIYSLRTVHEWLKKDRYVFVVPLEAIVTLDLLKKGDLPINFAARKATRFLEDRISRKPLDFKTFDGSITTASAISSSLSPERDSEHSPEKSKSGNSNSILKSTPGLYAQRESDKVIWDRLKERRQKVLKERKGEQEGEIEERESLDQDRGHVMSLGRNREETTVKSFHSEQSHHRHLHEESKPPSYIKELLQCCGFYFQLSRNNQSREYISEDPQSGIDSGIGEVVVILAYPPPPSEDQVQKTVSLSSTLSIKDHHHHDSEDSRTNGIINEKWLKEFGFDILRVETSSSWLGTKLVDHKFQAEQPKEKEKEKEKEKAKEKAEEKGRDGQESKGQVASDFRIW